MAASDIMLGEGVIFLDGTAIGLTRGGSQFVIEREYRVIEADGDYGPVMGRIRKTRSVAKLTINALELTIANMKKFFPASLIASNGSIFTSNNDIGNSDYHTVTFVGRALDGKQISIIVNNAINLENFDLSMIDKEEVVASITFTATYLESDRNFEPWLINIPT